MKKITLLISMFIIAAASLAAQGTNTEFDPAKQPVAIRTDTGLIINTVSDYILIKSLKAQAPGIGRITGVECINAGKTNYLRYRLSTSNKTSAAQYVIIPLEERQNNQIFVNGSGGGGYTCTGTNCQCGPNGPSEPCGCCTKVNSSSSALPITLKKVSYAIETFENN